jgi:viologen exporter family transport system ATP-binding protein
MGSSAPAISVEALSKTYVVPVRPPGLGAAFRSLVRRESRRVTAVDAIGFSVEPGEVVGFLGPNGAGKTTTLKMLSGLLHPSSGSARVLGFLPWERQHPFLRQMTLVMGQRNQLIWDIPVADSFERNRAIYAIEPGKFRRTVDELVSLLDLSALLERPVRNLSLGERMKCELAVALLHEPQVLFLDEPTIGVDVTMQRRIREFVAGYNRRTGATVLLTSHYMADVEALCRRVIVIHHGRILFDGQLSELVASFASHKTVTIELDGPAPDLSQYGEVIARENERVTLRVEKADTAKLTARLLADLPVIDLAVEDPPIEEVIERVFAVGPE